MNKIYLVLVCLFVAPTLKSQILKSGPQEVVPASNVINVGVSFIDETIADDFFADADKSEKRGELNEALALFGKAAFEYNSDKKFNRYAISLLRMSNVHFQLTHYVEAEQIILNSALKTYSSIGNKSGQMASYNQLGKIYLASNRLTQSLWFYTQQGILAQQLKNSNAYIESILGIAAVKIKKKEYVLALKDVDRAELLAKNAKSTQFSSLIKLNRATIADKQLVKNKTK